MILETSDDKGIKNPDTEEISRSLAEIGKRLDFCRLISNSHFIQASLTAKGILISYQDETGLYRSGKDSLSIDTAKTLFHQYADGREDWKGLIPFEFLPGKSNRNYLKKTKKSR